MSERRFTLLCSFTLAAVVGVSLAVAMWSDPLAEQPLRLLFITSGSGKQQQAMAEGARAAAKECGVELAVRSVDAAKPQSLAESIASVVVNGIQGAVVSQGLSDNLAPQLRTLSGVANVVTCGAKAGVHDPLVHVGTNPYSAGRVCANLVTELLPAGGRVLVVVGDGADAVSAQRLTGFQEAIEWGGRSPRWQVIERIADSQFAYADIDCIVDLRERLGESAATCELVDLARSRDIKFITFDQSEEAIAAVETGEVYAVICDNSYSQGYQAVHHLASICRGSDLRRPKPGFGHVFVPATIVRRGNVAEYRAHALTAMMAPAA